MDRRDFLRVSGVLGAAAVWGAAAESRAGIAQAAEPSRRELPLSAIGLQLYTVRTLMKQDVERTLTAVASAGYPLVETAGFFGHTPADFRAMLDRAGLRSVSGHYSLEELESKADATFAGAHALGQQYVVPSWIDEPLRRSRADYVSLAARCNAIGARARDAGLRLAFHNHDFEFDTFGSSTPALDTLIEHTDPALVTFELDAYWAYKAGYDPVAYLKRHPGRFALCHLKDGTRAPARAMVDVGAGVIDFRRLLRETKTAGLRYAFVEHDEPTDPIASIRASHAALAHLLRSA